MALLFTLGTLFGELNSVLDGFTAAADAIGEPPALDDWIFAESKLRTAMVYFMIASHYELYFDLPCNRDGDYTFEEIDLPASKSLWEASTSQAWHLEYSPYEERLNNGGRKARETARPKYGDLLALNKRQLQEHPAYGSDRAMEERIQEWQKHFDDFGILVALCSTLV